MMPIRRSQPPLALASVIHPFRPSFFLLLALTLLIGAGLGCGRQAPKQPNLSEEQVRELATKYRDEWVAKNTSGEAAVLARSTVVSVERQSQGWRVTFATATGHSPATPEGIHHYYLHIYLTPSGELVRIERGPDLMSRSWSQEKYCVILG